MKISRWIWIPLFFALSMGLLYGLFDRNSWFIGFRYGFVLGAIQGLILQLWSDWRTRKIAKKNREEDFSVKQKRKMVLLANFDTAFDWCVRSIWKLKTAKIKVEDKTEGIIKAKNGFSFYSFATDITFNLTRINQNLTEIEILTRPSLKTTIVDYGESLKIIEEITKYLQEKDAAINKKILVDSAEILEDVYVKPFQKEIVWR